jgi:hypothetical protein
MQKLLSCREWVAKETIDDDLRQKTRQNDNDLKKFEIEKFLEFFRKQIFIQDGLNSRPGIGVSDVNRRISQTDGTTLMFYLKSWKLNSKQLRWFWSSNDDSTIHNWEKFRVWRLLGLALKYWRWGGSWCGFCFALNESVCFELLFISRLGRNNARLVDVQVETKKVAQAVAAFL